MTVLIMGGGLSGLALTDALEIRGKDHLLLEAHARFGRRLKTEQHGAGYFDMRPAWFWPGRPRIAALVDQLKFDQFSARDLAFENEHGQVQRKRGISSMVSSGRLKRGLAAMTQALADRLSEDRKRLNATVTQFTRSEAGVVAALSTVDSVNARQAVASVPPHVAANISFIPHCPMLHGHRCIAFPHGWQNTPKPLSYATPFLAPRRPFRRCAKPTWVNGVPLQNRTNRNALNDPIAEQLVHLFEPKAASPKQLHVKDWAYDPHTPTNADHVLSYARQRYGMPSSLAHL